MMKAIWEAAKGHFGGDVRLEGEEVVARYSNVRNKLGEPRIRSELIYARSKQDDEETFEYQFVLSGTLNRKETVIWQFHDHWDIPEGITIAGKQFLYAKVTPPILLFIVGNELFLRHAKAESQPLLNIEKKWLEFDFSIQTHFYRTIELDKPILLKFGVKWSCQEEGYFISPELTLENISTMYNNRPPLIQCGLYGSGYIPEGIIENRIQKISIRKKS